MQKLYKIKLFIKTLTIFIGAYIRRLINRLKGYQLSPQGMGLKNYAYEELCCIIDPSLRTNSINNYEKMQYENIIQDYMNTRHYSREHALTIIFLTLDEYDEPKDKVQRS